MTPEQADTLIREAFNNYGATGREKMAALRAALIASDPEELRLLRAVAYSADAWRLNASDGVPEELEAILVAWRAARVASPVVVIDAEELRLLRWHFRTCRVCGDGLRCKSACSHYCANPNGERHYMGSDTVCPECGSPGGCP